MRFLDTGEDLREYTVKFSHKELISIMRLIGEHTDNDVRDHGLDDLENNILTEVHSQLTSELLY